MRRTTAAVLAAACLTLAGCGSSTDAGAAKPSPSPTVDPDKKFINSVTGADLHSYATKGMPAASELEAFPPKWCTALDAGHSVDWMLGDAGGLYPWGADWGTEKADAYQLVVFGVAAYCPKYSAQVKTELRDEGVY
ncbi:hypothetical protein ACWDE0_22030 [Streptomyces sp. 900105755]